MKTLQDKSYIFRLRTSKQFTGKYQDAQIYSALARTATWDGYETQTSLAEIARMDRGTAVAKSVQWLVKQGLATQDGCRIIALPPPHDWFHWKTDEKDNWWDNLCYHPEYLLSPESTLTTRANSVLWLIVSWTNDKGSVPSQLTLATQLGLGRKCVAACLQQLETNGFTLGGWPDLADKLHNWVDRKEKTTTSFGKPLKDEELAGLVLGRIGPQYADLIPDTCYNGRKNLFEEGLARLVKALRAAHYPDKAIPDMLWGIFRATQGHVPVIEVFVMLGKRLLGFAEENTRESRLKGIFKGPNSMGAFRIIATRYVEQLVERRKHERQKDGTDINWWTEYDPTPAILKTLWMQPNDK